MTFTSFCGEICSSITQSPTRVCGFSSFLTVSKPLIVTPSQGRITRKPTRLSEFFFCSIIYLVQWLLQGIMSWHVLPLRPRVSVVTNVSSCSLKTHKDKLSLWCESVTDWCVSCGGLVTGYISASSQIVRIGYSHI